MPSVYDTAINIIKDPALPALIQRIGVLKKILLADEPVPPGGAPPTSTTPTTPGVGLDSAVKAIDSYLWFRKNRWVAGVAVGGLILVPSLLGFVLGRLSARPTKAKPALAGALKRGRKNNKKRRLLK
jgi:hypothetical protein